MSSAPWIPIEIVDLDSDNDGIIGSADQAAFNAAHPSTKDDPEYDKQFDANFDTAINDADKVIFDALYAQGISLATIQEYIKLGGSGDFEHLVWPDGWGCWLCVCNPSYIAGFFKVETFWLGENAFPGSEPWTGLSTHPSPDYRDAFLSGGEYYCHQYALDTMIASYKGLGYGCILYALRGGHCDNIVWKGGGWRQLSNWANVSAYSNTIYFDAYELWKVSSDYTKLTEIWFPDYIEEKEEYGYTAKYLHYHYLTVDGANNKVSYGGSRTLRAIPSFGYFRTKEPMPGTFDRTLGVPYTVAAPTVISHGVFQIEETTAFVNGDITNIGREKCDQRGIEWGTVSGNYPNKTVDSGVFSEGQFGKWMSGLSPGTTYYCRAKARNSAGWGYSEEQSFTTEATVPTVSTQPPSSVEQTSAIGNGTIVDTGGEKCDQQGVEWGLSSGNYYASSTASGSFGTGSFTRLMQGLSAETTYYYQAKAHNSMGWSYGNEVTFTTLTADADKLAYDAGAGIENLSDRTITKAETGEGVESYKRTIIAEIASLIATYSRDEVGSGLDALLDRHTGSIDVLGADSGSGVGSYKRSKLGEISRLLATIAKDDAGSGSGASTGYGRISGDVGIGIEALLNRFLALHEEGIATDEVAQLIIVVTAITSSDSGVGEDVLSQLEALRGIISPGDLRNIVATTKRAIAIASKRNIVSPTKRDIVSSGGLRRIE